MIHWMYKAYYKNTIDNCNREKAKPIKKAFIEAVSLHFSQSARLFLYVASDHALRRMLSTA